MYRVPLNGTFYVPEDMREIVANIPPTAGDFARGLRDEERGLIVAIVRPDPYDDAES